MLSYLATLFSYRTKKFQHSKKIDQVNFDHLYEYVNMNVDFSIVYNIFWYLIVYSLLVLELLQYDYSCRRAVLLLFCVFYVTSSKLFDTKNVLERFVNGVVITYLVYLPQTIFWLILRNALYQDIQKIIREWQTKDFFWAGGVAGVLEVFQDHGR